MDTYIISSLQDRLESSAAAVESRALGVAVALARGEGLKEGELTAIVARTRGNGLVEEDGA